MKTYKILALDETGKASFNHPSKNFVLSGIIISESFKPKLSVSMRKLKKKFFKDEEIVFHVRDMLRKKGPFSTLATNKKLEINFWTNFLSILNSEKISIAFVITDKAKAIKLSWKDVTILRRAYRKMLEEFVKKHLHSTKSCGKIIAESDPTQDTYLIEAHNKLQGSGIPSEGITGPQYRAMITSLSLVNKLNLDDDIQIADSLAVMADVVYEIKLGNKKGLTRVQKIMKRLIERKMKDNLGVFEILV